MSQLVTIPNSFELASKLEELSGLASQIVRFSDELRAVSPSDLLEDSASVCALLPVALLNAQSCLSILQLINQTSVSHPSPPAFTSPAPGTPARPPTPTPITTEPDHSLPSALPPAIGTPHLPAIPLDLLFLSRRTTPTESWPLHPLPLPSVRATFGPSIHPTLGGHPDNEYPPSSSSPSSPTRHGVSIANLVDEEGSHPGTRGGMKPSSPPAATCINTSPAQGYPPLFISIVDVTPPFTGNEVPEAPEVPEIKSLPSSPLSPPAKFFATRIPAPPLSPLMFPVSNDRHHAAGEDRKTLRRSPRKGVSLVAPERPVMRSAKREAPEDSGMNAERSKRARTNSP